MHDQSMWVGVQSGARYACIHACCMLVGSYCCIVSYVARRGWGCYTGRAFCCGGAGVGTRQTSCRTWRREAGSSWTVVTQDCQTVCPHTPQHHKSIVAAHKGRRRTLHAFHQVFASTSRARGTVGAANILEADCCTLSGGTVWTLQPAHQRHTTCCVSPNPHAWA